MSTNRKKIYNKNDIYIAQEEIKKVEKYFTRKTNRRKTVQVRISEKWHHKIKEAAGDKKIMISFFLVKVCEHFFKYYE